MKKFLLCLSVMFSIMFCVILSGCGVVPAAWVTLDMEGYVIYTSHMYPSGGNHIYLYASEEEALADTYRSDYLMYVVFYPRILGADRMVDGHYTSTIVDISSSYSMKVCINKNKSIYSQDKKIYLNDTALEPVSKRGEEPSSSLLFLDYEGFTLVRGNPDGHINDFVNKLKYE